MSVSIAPVVNALVDFADAYAAAYIVARQVADLATIQALRTKATTVAIGWIPTQGLAAQLEHGSLESSVNQFSSNIGAAIPGGYATMAKAPLVFAPVLYLTSLVAARYAAPKGT